MALSADDYLDLLQKLLPQGPAWPRDDDAALTSLLTGLAQEFHRIDVRADNLLQESDPRTTYELLGDWERAAGLPDSCWMLALNNGNSTGTRRDALVARWTGTGGQSKAYFISLAAALGYPNATIEEFEPATCDGACDASLNTLSSGWPFAWIIHVNDARETIAECDGACDDNLRDWGNEIFECVMQKYRPAHTTVFFGYGE